MAKRITEILVDDLDGTEIAEGEGRTIQFSLEGVNYEIDLTNDHAIQLREALSDYLAAARTVASSSRTSTRAGSRASSGTRSHAAGGIDLKAARTWLRAQGLEVSDRGRIPAVLLAKYEDAH